MANSTTLQRQLYAPACTAKGNKYITAYAALDAKLKKYSYRPRSGVTGAYNCRKITGGTGYSLHSYGPGTKFKFWNGLIIATSLAVDINWDKNPYGPRLITDMPRAMVDEIEAIRTNNGKQVWRWGGYYAGNKDAMHYEIVCGPADLATGIKSSSTPAPAPKPPVTPAPEPVKEEEMHRFRIMWYKGEPTAPGDQADILAAYKVHEVYVSDSKKWFGTDATWIDSPNDLNILVYLGIPEVGRLNTNPVTYDKTGGSKANPLPIGDWDAGLVFWNGPFKNQ